MNDRRTVIGEILTRLQEKLALPNSSVRIVDFKLLSVDPCVGQNKS